MIKYRVWDNLNSIIEVEAEKETDKSIWIDGRKSNKRSVDFYNYFDSKRACIWFLIEKKKKEIDIIRQKESRLLNKRIKLRDELFELDKENK